MNKPTKPGEEPMRFHAEEEKPIPPKFVDRANVDRYGNVWAWAVEQYILYGYE